MACGNLHRDAVSEEDALRLWNDGLWELSSVKVNLVLEETGLYEWVGLSRYMLVPLEHVAKYHVEAIDTSA